MSDPSPDVFTSKTRKHTTRKLILKLTRKFDEAVDFTTMFIVNLNSLLASVGVARVGFDDGLVEKLIESLVLCLCAVSKPAVLNSRPKQKCTNFGHATPECCSIIAFQDGLGCKKTVDPVICVFVNQSAQLGLNLKLYAAVRYLLNIGSSDNVDKKEICDYAWYFFYWFHSGDRMLPSSEYILGARRRGGSSRLGMTRRLRLDDFGSLGSSVFRGSIHMVVSSFMKHKISVLRQVFAQATDALSPNGFLGPINSFFPSFGRRLRLECGW